VIIMQNNMIRSNDARNACIRVEEIVSEVRLRGKNDI
jgi:hypothetical protein